MTNNARNVPNPASGELLLVEGQIVCAGQRTAGNSNSMQSMKKHFSLLIAALLITSCATMGNKTGIEPSPRHANRVQVATFDSVLRPKTTHAEVFDDPKSLQKPFKDIALLSCEGKPSEEAPMTQAIIYRARMLGADAIIILPPSRSGWGDRRVFRAKAIVYDKP